jgi:26S proteasome regulatory subunit N5
VWEPLLKRICWLIVLSPHAPMQQSLLHATAGDTKLSDLPLHKDLLKKFVAQEIIRWPEFTAAYSAEMAAEAAVFGGEVRSRQPLVSSPG